MWQKIYIYISYKGTSLRLLSVDFSAETLQSRREWDDMFKLLEKTKQNKKLQPRNNIKILKNVKQ